jgi:hypothetical protein
MTNCPSIVFVLAAGLLGGDLYASELHVSPRGRDDNIGTTASPLLSFAGARGRVRELKGKSTGPITVIFHAGTYRLPETLVFRSEDSGTENAPITYAAAPGEEVVVSGGFEIRSKWKPYRNGIFSADVSRDCATD